MIGGGVAVACRPLPCQRILVVDDNSVNREVICATLEPFGFAVSLAANVRDGLALARQGNYRLILSDLHMPGEDGFQFLAAVRSDARLREIPFIVITSSIWGDRDGRRSLELGAMKFILRPVEPQCLLREVAECLAAGSAAAAAGPGGGLYAGRNPTSPPRRLPTPDSAAPATAGFQWTASAGRAGLSGKLTSS